MFLGSELCFSPLSRVSGLVSTIRADVSSNVLKSPSHNANTLCMQHTLYQIIFCQNNNVTTSSVSEITKSRRSKIRCKQRNSGGSDAGNAACTSSVLLRLEQWQQSGGAKLDLSGCSLEKFSTEKLLKVQRCSSYAKKRGKINIPVLDGCLTTKAGNNSENAGSTPKNISSLAKEARQSMFLRLSKCDCDEEKTL